MTESNQGPATPGTAARCECHSVGNALDCPQHRREAGYALLYECDSLHTTLAAVQQYARDLRQQVEDTIMVAQKDVDADDWITAYHFKTGAIHRLLAKARDIIPEASAASQPEAAPEAVPEIERLKAENASLSNERDVYRRSAESSFTELDASRDALAAAEQRAEAAEKALFAAQQSLIREGMERDRAMELARAAEQRNTELEGALRLILDAMFVCYGGRKAMRGVWFKDSHDAVGLYDAARAALHDEERSAPPQTERKHWPDCALNHGGTECDMGPDCGKPGAAQGEEK